MDNNKKLVILMVLAAVAAASILYGLTAPMKGKRGTIARRKAVQKQELARKAVIEVPVKRCMARSKFTSWRRNPFSPRGAAGSGPSSLVLNGILSDGKNLKAVIGDTIVKKGDRFGDYKVVDIRKSSVIINDGTADRELKLER